MHLISNPAMQSIWYGHSAIFYAFESSILIDPMFGEDAAQLHLSKSNDLAKYFSY
jgi:L-ascorbate metabolism protein UlaG (beta-lactamase superfamily)